jgi:undecaprenyl diphosphate synthase
MRDRIEEAVARTARNSNGVLNVCLNYGGRAELVDAVRKLVKEGVPSDQIDESAIASRLYVPDLPDPDLIIRTAGESRVSNFLLWQSAYSELLVTETLWPDFGVEELKAAIADYNSRIRRFGGRPEHELAAGNASR